MNKKTAAFIPGYTKFSILKKIKHFFLFLNLFLKKHIFTDKNQLIILPILFLALFLDIFALVGVSDIRFFGITGIFLISVFLYQIDSKFTFILCLLLLIIMYISFLSSGPSVFTEKVAVWIVLFLIVGILQQWYE